VIYSVFDCGHGPVMDLHYTPSQTGLYVPTCRWLSVAFCQSQTILVPEMLSCTSFQLFCLLAVVTVCVESSPYRWPIWRKKSCTKVNGYWSTWSDWTTSCPSCSPQVQNRSVQGRDRRGYAYSYYFNQQGPRFTRRFRSCLGTSCGGVCFGSSTEVKRCPGMKCTAQGSRWHHMYSLSYL
jgi:hypothetical protein